MYEPAEVQDGLLAMVLFLVWAGAAVVVSGLARRRDQARLRRGARWAVGLAVAGIVIIAVRLVLFGVMWSVGWLFAETRVVVALPLLALPLVAVGVLTAPRLLRLARTARTDAAPGVELRAAASAPALIVPVQAMATGALLAVDVAYIFRPTPSYLDDLAAHLGVLAGVTALFWLRQRRRHAALSRPEAPARPGVRRRVTRAVIGVAAAAALLAGALVGVAQASRLPDELSMMSHENLDWGGGPVGAHHDDAVRSVEELTGPRDGTPDRRFTLTAQETQIRLSSGAVVSGGWTYNGQAPGPELRVRQGDLVEVTLVNRLPADGVTIHWHGVDLPNREDGVAGVTQDAVQPGQSYVYRFRADQVGTFWYHTHQDPLWAVRRGLFGALVIEPREAAPAGADITVLPHEWRIGAERRPAFGVRDTLEHRRMAPGTTVRLRLINTDNNPYEDAGPREFALVGTPFQVAAIDGTDLAGPTDLEGVRLGLAAGGRYDLTFTMPDRPVRLADVGKPDVSLVLSPDGRAEPPAVPEDLELFDAGSYGRPGGAPFGLDSDYDREFTQLLDDRIWFFDGGMHFLPTINGKSFPHVPSLMVREGDLVKVLIVNRSHQNHPMHLHGHHALVLSHDGRPVTGSPWWVDSLDLRPGETFEIAFRADNPGIWMDHCHNLDHAANGMTMHLAYEGVSTPYKVGRATVNQPE
ncbi:multicopper oxidase family protein [Jidongwangia harbinensis]|uniref:multicopper oxidase family protein n=1 Tax=Jidongwangia harbinensis TaxID=2878561 RepID=UPI001CDA24F9|nr:multicopper oxidase family protein [Jidongwangia harbinensis]MCA2219198.1 multicopper oxidase family protein [Jidongwangia harbinensis]